MLVGLNLLQCRNVLGQTWRKNTDLGKLSIKIYFMKMGLPMAAIYRVCQCIETRKIAKRKAESGRRSTDARKEEEPAREGDLGQERSHLNETG